MPKSFQPGERRALEKESKSLAVELKGVYKRFDKVVAVEKMDLEFEEGTLVTLLGPSGCGKTTILRMIAGLESPTEGDIFIQGKRVNDTPIHKRNLGMIFQNYALFPHKTIFDNVAFGLKYRSVPRQETRDRVKRALEMVRLPGVEDRMPSQLSGGQQQRIALARAIVIEPVVLLMDEPLSALDENLREEMRMEVDNLQQLLGVTTIFVTHDQREALSMSDRIVVMKDGRKQQEGGPEDVYNNPVNHFVADFLGHSNFINGEVLGREGEYTKVRVEDGNEIYAPGSEAWKPGEPVELVVRAQKFDLLPDKEDVTAPEINTFKGIVKDRSYMGGEVSYFVELANGTVLHAISMVSLKPYRRGETVLIHVPPRHCGLLKREN
ncbi:MAG: ABC transporter ATP-binding protein [Deltaproteobacteria bacterium]|nr:ABC transporter ATP-binding protein [Deltaproteobacteria bacterium]